MSNIEFASSFVDKLFIKAKSKGNGLPCCDCKFLFFNYKNNPYTIECKLGLPISKVAKTGCNEFKTRESLEYIPTLNND